MRSVLLIAHLCSLAVAVPYALSSRSANSTQHNSTHHLRPGNLTASANSSTTITSSWWYPNVDHTSAAVRDYAPFLNSGGSPDYNYPVYMAVTGGNASAFIDALYSDGPNGDRDNGYLAAEPRTVYVGPGTYVFSETVYLDTDTVIIGDAINPPVFQAASGFNGDYLICGGEGGDTEMGGESHFSVSRIRVDIICLIC